MVGGRVGVLHVHRVKQWERAGGRQDRYGERGP